MRGPDTLGRCGLLMAVPLTRDRFLADANDGRMDFVRQWVASFVGYTPERLWRDYERIAGYGLQIVEEARKGGVHVVTDAPFASWPLITRTKEVVTLVAHWVAGSAPAIEYADGPRSLHEVVEALPADFAGVVDLTVCNSTRAIAAIKRARPRCSVLANRDATRLDLRLAMYRQVLRLVDRERTCYLEAAHRVHLAALERI